MQPLEYICFLSMRSALDDGLSVTGGALCDPALRFSAAIGAEAYRASVAARNGEVVQSAELHWAESAQ